MHLIQDTASEDIPRIGSVSGVDFEEKIAYLCFFDRESEWRWFVLEFDPEDTCFGLIVSKSGVAVGRFTLTELAGLQSSRDPFELSVARDEDFRPVTVAELCVRNPKIRAGLKQALSTAADLVQLNPGARGESSGLL